MSARARTQTRAAVGGTSLYCLALFFVRPYFKLARASLLPVASHKPQSRVLRPGSLRASGHVSLQLLCQSALSTLISVLLEE